MKRRMNGAGRRARTAHARELNEMVSRNRLRLGAIAAVFTALVMGLSAAALFLLYRPLGYDRYFWLILVLFWAAFVLYALLRFLRGWRWLFGRVISLPPGTPDSRLRHALDAACLAAGLSGEVRLRVIPHDDVNSYSLALPDGTYAVFATKGVEEKLPQRAAEAMMAHEVGHIQAGDALLHTVMLALTGRAALASMSMERGAWIKRAQRKGELQIEDLPAVITVVVLAMLVPLASSFSANPRFPLMLLLTGCIFVLVSLLISPLAHSLLRLGLDREREYFADLLAAWRTRDPLAVYRALEGAACDFADVMLLPPYLDALLFHPVVDYTSYRPFQTQPTMWERMERLKEEFPSLRAELAGESGEPPAGLGGSGGALSSEGAR